MLYCDFSLSIIPCHAIMAPLSMQYSIWKNFTWMFLSFPIFSAMSRSLELEATPPTIVYSFLFVYASALSTISVNMANMVSWREKLMSSLVSVFFSCLILEARPLRLRFIPLMV